MKQVVLHSPQPLSPQHRVADFCCGEGLLDEWLQQRALANQYSGASRTFVVADGQGRVVGYYALAAGAVSRRNAPGAVRRNMPEPIPVMVLGRLAVDLGMQGHQMGAALLRDAVQRAANVSEHVGVRAIMVHALHDSARKFYEYHGFHPSPTQPLTLLLPLPAK